MAGVAVDRQALSCGGVVRASQQTVTAGGVAVLRVDDLADPHNHGDDHITDEKMAAGSAGVTTGGKAICRQGDASNYGNTLTGGSATVSAG